MTNRAARAADHRGMPPSSLFVIRHSSFPSLSQPVVADDLGQGLAPAGDRAGAWVLARDRVAEDDHRARDPLGRDAEDLLAVLLLRLVPEPGRAAAEPEEVRADQQALADPALVVGLADGAPAVEHDRDHQR